MALPTPNLDDRTFEQIRDEAVRLIPQYCPEWTNYNPSDPGITLSRSMGNRLIERGTYGATAVCATYNRSHGGGGRGQPLRTKRWRRPETLVDPRERRSRAG